MVLAQTFILLLSVILILEVLAKRLRIVEPIFLVVGGVGLSTIPGVPRFELDPELIFFLFFPPLLYAQAWFTSIRDFRKNMRPILLLAVGAVLVTTLVVGYAVHWVIGLPLAAAMALGAVVAPPDAVAASAIASRVRLPKRLLTIISGESLVNDATSLVALQLALGAALGSKQFTLQTALFDFLWVTVGGVFVGGLVGWGVSGVHRRLKETTAQVLFSLIAPYSAYLFSHSIHASEVIATVVAGLWVSWFAPQVLSASDRIEGAAVWRTLTSFLEKTIFVLIGLQLPSVMARLAPYSSRQLLAYAVLVSALVVVVRPLWIYPAAWLPRILSQNLSQRDPLPSPGTLFALSWCGMRGVITLAAALSIPLTTLDGTEFPGRDIIIFLSFVVIVVTLLVQGCTLSPLLRWLNLAYEGEAERELVRARAVLAKTGLRQVQDAVTRRGIEGERIADLLREYRERERRISDELLGRPIRQTLCTAQLAEDLRAEAQAAERDALIQMYHRQEIDDETLNHLQRELDLEESKQRKEDG